MRGLAQGLPQPADLPDPADRLASD